MFNFTGLSNTNLQSEDIKVMGANKIRFSAHALEVLKASHATHRIFIDKDRNSNKFYVAAIDIKEDEAGKVISEGKSFNKDGAFSHAILSKKLGGQNSTWSIAEEGIEHEGVTYFEITQDDVKREVESMTAAGMDSAHASSDHVIIKDTVKLPVTGELPDSVRIEEGAAV